MLLLIYLFMYLFIYHGKVLLHSPFWWVKECVINLNVYIFFSDTYLKFLCFIQHWNNHTWWQKNRNPN